MSVRGEEKAGVGISLKNCNQNGILSGVDRRPRLDEH